MLSKNIATLAKIALIPAIALVAMSSQAVVTYSNTVAKASQPYVGIKVGKVDTDFVGAPKATNYGVYGGYNFDQNLGAELEYQGAQNKDYIYNGVAYEQKAKTYGAYGTYRYQLGTMPVYAKGRLGVAKTDLSTTAKTGKLKTEKNSTTLAGGFGLGFAPANNMSVEATYNYLSGDAKGVSLGAHVAF